MIVLSYWIMQLLIERDLCGASSKDAGARITSIVEDYGVSKYAPVIAALLKNPPLVLPH